MLKTPVLQTNTAKDFEQLGDVPSHLSDNLSVNDIRLGWMVAKLLEEIEVLTIS